MNKQMQPIPVTVQAISLQQPKQSSEINLLPAKV